VLYERHHAAVLAFARRLCSDPQRAEDLASEAFARTLRTVRTGAAGPSGGWRPYLYAVVRNTAAEWARVDQRMVLTAEFGEEFAERWVEEPQGEGDFVVRAYRSLPPRWQTVLWHTLIEEEKPEEVAKILGITPANVGVLACRAREGLRKAYLAAHVTGSSPDCRTFADSLATVVRKPGSRIPRSLRTHLDTCPSCSRAHEELRDLNATLRAGLIPVALLPLAGKAVAAKSASSAAPGWAIPATVVAAAAAVAVALTLPTYLPPLPSLPAPVSTSLMDSAPPTPMPTVTPTSTPAATLKSTPKATAKSTRKPTSIPSTNKESPAPTGASPKTRAGDPRPSTVATDPAGPPVRSSTVYTFKNIGSGIVLDVPDDSTAHGTQLVQWTANGGANQRWRLTPSDDGTFVLVSIANGLCADVSDESTEPGAAVIQWPCTGRDNQRWYLKGDAIVAKHSGLLLTATGGHTGATMVQSADTGSELQRWTRIST
jgi:RNA polymerase sigma factor (sigma-70 family)